MNWSGFKFPTTHSTRHASAISPPVSREVCHRCPALSNQRAQGMPGAQCARSRACSVESTRVSHHGHTGITRHSPRNGFTAYFVLSPVIGLSCHRHLAELPPRDLTPASRRQDHTTSPSAKASFVRALFARLTLPRPPHPVPYVRDDREAPLCVGRDGGSFRTDSGSEKPKYFFKMGLTAISLICPSGPKTGPAQCGDHGFP